MKAIVIINEQHSLLPDQNRILNSYFDSYELYKVPADGWTIEEMNEEVDDDLIQNNYNSSKAIVFASPVPYLLAHCASVSGRIDTARVEYGSEHPELYVYLFHNDKREKKELPNDKVISVVAKEGWQLVRI